ncbi:terminase [Jeotgalibaca porci]|uniref:terminase n=1 Tax=Jeotgalibaca porci TaxID=1868793 RepID=UPI0035A07B57
MTKIGAQFPTVSVILPYQHSKASEAIDSYEESGREAYEWQLNVLEPMMAYDVESGLWIHMKYGYSIPRQNGKNEVVAMREFEGLKKGERILHTAHRTTTSKAAFNRLIKIMEESGLEEKVHFKKIQAIGQERIEIFDAGEISFRTRSSLGGLGESFDLLIIDEAQEYTDDQESALKYTIAASPNPQTVYCGTPPTPHSSGTVFTGLREQALSGRTEDVGWAEWSVPEQSDVRDPELWYKTNPSLGLRITERIIRSEIGDDEIDFNIQRLGLWLKYNQKSAITENEWNELKVDKLPELEGKLFVGIKYGHDGTNVAMSIAVKTKDKKIFVESIDCRSIREGNTWILSFLKSSDVGEVVVDGANGQVILTEQIKELNKRLKVGQKIKLPTLPTVKEIIVANSKFEQELFQQNIQHNNQPSLSTIVTNADKRNIGSSGGFGYRSQVEEHDVSLMDSVILAHWACSNAKPAKKQRINY